jgi:flagellar hook-associated protein 1 FlgK
MATGTLGIALTGLNAAQAGIRTTQHNISNVKTAGFRRQEVDYAALTPGFSGTAFYGTGVGVSTVRSLYSQFQDSQVLLDQTQLSRNESYAAQASQIDTLAGDANSGLTGAMEKFFNAAQTVASDPTSDAARQVMLSSGRNLASRFNTLATAFNDIRVDSNHEIAATVASINTYASQIATLSGNIARAEASTGQPANDLRDQRDQLVAELNKLINVTPVQQGDGAFNLFVGSGQPLVVGTRAATMSSMPDATNPQYDVPALSLAGGVTQPLDASMVTGGKLGGLMAVRTDVLQPAMQDLDRLAYEFATQFNSQHSAGFDKSGAAGGNFFTDLSALPSPYTGAARMFAMDAAMTDPSKIAASSSSAGSPGDNANALALAGLQTTASIGGSTFAGFYAQLVARTATLASEADISVSAYESITSQARQAQQAISGVNLDEEATNLIRFQQAYQASAKAMQVASSLFDTLIGVMR